MPDKKTTIRIPAELARKLKVKCAAAGITQTDVILRAIDEFLSDTPGMTQALPKDQRNQRWHDRMEAVLQSEGMAAEIVQQVIRCAYELVLSQKADR